ncbi:hypothetical protein ACRB68_19870 [Actinomadura sp. RB68]|uniref:Aminopeptidase N n=2 Tax=Actinomadura macrotermitis TaxID=2585200 RepID=A0A7K0BS07_9ACTN|nr:hypothetical protein [Actinomadura macrotermitis]
MVAAGSAAAATPEPDLRVPADGGATSCEHPPLLEAPAPPLGTGHAHRRLAVPPPDVPALARPGAVGTDTPRSAGTALDDCVRPLAPTAPSPSPSAKTPGAAAEPHLAGKPGKAGIGDPYFTSAGNGGYDVTHYDVALKYLGASGAVEAAVTITARATEDLSRFDLDYRGPKITSTTVNGRPAAARRDGAELVLTPAATLPAGSVFTTAVRYAGRPGPIRSSAYGDYGWVPTGDGALVVSEPDGAPTWLPVNDHPSDKATYTFHLRVPKGLQALASGRPVQTVRRGAFTDYEWAETAPMASYLAMIAIGRFAVRQTKAGPTPVITAVDPRFAKHGARLQRDTVAALKWERGLFGRYPFATAGGIVDDPRLDYALETQERPVYAGFAPDDSFVVHELAHQWFGNSVSLDRWQDIWLNEGIATYTEWLWQEHNGTDTAKAVFQRYYRQPAKSPIFNPPAGRPGRTDLFGYSVYVRGAMALQALRDRIGDKRFFAVLRTWAAEHAYGNAGTADFVALAEKVSGKRLGTLFDQWLYQKGKPKKW